MRPLDLTTYYIYYKHGRAKKIVIGKRIAERYVNYLNKKLNL